jgi:hypothetical protein
MDLSSRTVADDHSDVMDVIDAMATPKTKADNVIRLRG